MTGKDARMMGMTRQEETHPVLRDRIARILIALAAFLLLADVVWVFPHLAALLLDAVRRSPEGEILAAAFVLLVAAWWIRSGRRGRQTSAP